VESRLATLIVVAIVAGTVVMGLIVGAQRDDRTHPVDLIVYNGRVFTGAGAPMAEALAVRGNQILRVGPNREVKRLRGRSTKVIDAHGGSVLPGFNDSHLHFVSGGLGLERVNLLDAETLEAIQAKIGAYAKANPDRAWILGRGWYYSPFPGGLPTRQLLDAVVPDRPAYMTCFDGHTSWANTKALELAGITRTTKDPVNGSIVKDPKTGEPTGVLKEAAMGLMSAVVPQPTPEDRLRAIRAAVAEANRLGITSVQEAGSSAAQIAQFEDVRRAGDLKVRVYAAMEVDAQTSEADADKLDALRTRYASDPVLRVGAIKMMLDGVIEANTAVMLAPYANKATSGEPMYPAADFNRVVSMFDRRGWQIMTHAIGDGAVRMTLDAYERAALASPVPGRGRRHRVEHAETIDPADIPRFGKGGVIVSYMPYHANPTPAQADVWKANIGPDRASRGWIARTFIDAGAHVTFGSDWPVVSLDPRLEAQMSVTRKTPDGKPEAGWLPEQAIALDHAIDAVTAWPAYASFEEHRKGRLAPGQLADIVILSADVFALRPGRLLDAVVTVTIFDGKVVFERGRVSF
jgi:predicted amidohydrolase YtcJ